MWKFHQRPGDGHTLLLTAGELAGFSLHEFLNLHESRRVHGPFFHLRPGKLVLPFQVLQREDDVLPNREMRIERIVLKHHAHSAFFRRQRRHVLIPEKDLAAGRLFQAADHVQRRTFSTARGAQKADEFPVGDLEIKILHRCHPAAVSSPAGKAFGQVLQLNFHMLFPSYLSAYLFRPVSGFSRDSFSFSFL